jgi:hypothetical protein
MSAITSFLNGHGNLFGSDIFILVILFVIFFFYALYFGKNTIIATILAFYPAQFFYQNFPFMNSLLVLKGDSLLLLNKVLIFLLFLIPLTILIGRYVFQDSGYGSAHYFRSAAYSLAMIILVLIFDYSVVSLGLIHNFSPTISTLFTGANYIFLWNLAPLVLLFVL